MTSFAAMRSERGRTSPSFLIAALLVLLVVGGYAGWRVFRPNPIKLSEQIVRQSRRVLNAQVGEFEQALRDLEQKSGMDAGQRLRAIDEMANQTKSEIDTYLDEARARLSDLDIPLNTHQNRATRLNEKADDAKAMIDSRASAKRDQLGGG